MDNSQLKILITAALSKTAGKDLNEKLQKLKIQPIRVPVTLAKGVATTLNKQLKELKLKSYEIPLSVSSKSIKNAAKNINDQLNGNNVNTSLDSTLKKINTFRTRLADIQQSSYGLAHPIIDDQNQEKLSIAYKKIDDTINTVIKSGQKMTAAQEISIRKQISDVERLRKAYVQIERGAMALEQKPITFDIEKTKSGLSALEAKWRNQGIYSGEFEQNIEKIKVALSTVDDQEGISKINQDISLAKIKAGELNTELRKFNSVTAQSTAQSKLTTWLRENPKAMGVFKNQIDDLAKSIPKITNPAMNTSFNKQFADLTNGLKAVSKTGDTVFGNLIKNSQKFAAWLVASGGIMAAITTFKRMITTVIELDKALVDLQMATGGQRSQIILLLDSYNKLGQKLGATTKEVADSANSFLRQGMSISDTNTMIENSLILSKVGMISSAESTQYMTSAMKGYQVAVEKTLGIVDMLSGIDLVSATDAGGLSLAMSKTASSASIAGIEMSKLLSFLATVGEVTQKDMASIGESFKTIFSRMRDIRVGAKLDEEGESLSNVEDILSDVDIKLRNSVGEFRNFGDVLDDVGAKWDSYSGVEQAAIAKAFSGVRQQENFLVLMSNYGKALEYNEVAMNSSGTATEKMEAYNNSLEASLKRLTASFEALSTTFIGSDVVKNTIDWGIGFLKILNGIVSTFGTLGTAASVALGVVTAKGSGRIKMLILKKYATGISNGNINELRIA